MTNQTDIRIRRADLGHSRDLAAIADLVAAFGAEDGNLPAWNVREALGHHLRSRASFVLLAQTADENTPVAMLIAQRNLSSFTALDSCNIHDVYVTADARGRGIARRLMHVAEAHARALGCGKMTLEVNTDNHPALALYRSLGYDVPDADFPPGATLFVKKPL
jgi:ribosomal protein S18 acetylase RimI-like enzyme